MKENREYISMLRCISEGMTAIADFEEFGMTEPLENWVLKYGEKAKTWVEDAEFSNEITQLVTMINKAKKKMLN